MKKMFLFMMVSLDGFIEGLNHDLSWHNVDLEFNAFAAKQMREAGIILFGRKTYQLMESFWPSKNGLKDDPNVAKYMNNTPKVVFSKSLKSVKETKNWKNVTLFKNNIFEEVNKLKKENQSLEEQGKSIAVLGSNNLCVTLLELNLLDEMRIMINPVAIGKGTSLFQGIKKKLSFKLTKTKRFKNGNILLYLNPQN